MNRLLVRGQWYTCIKNEAKTYDILVKTNDGDIITVSGFDEDEIGDIFCRSVRHFEVEIDVGVTADETESGE